MRSLSAAIASGVVVTLLAGAGAASAGTYTFHTCRTQYGVPAGVGDWKVEWARSTSGRLTSSCPEGPLTLELAPNASHPPDDSATLTFQAPYGTQISAFKIYRDARLGPRYNYWRWELGTSTTERCHTTSGDCSALGDPAFPLGTQSLLQTHHRTGMTGIRFRLTCGEDDTKSTSCPAANPAAVLRIHRAAVALHDGLIPNFDAAPSGPLVDSKAPLTGVQSVLIAASDWGGGVYRATAEVDGQVVASGVLDDNGGLCREPFTVASPCPRRTIGALAVDTSKLSDGQHRLRLTISDASGTNVAEWRPITITTANGGCNTEPATATGLRLSAAFVRPARRRGGRATRRTSVKVAYKRKLRLSGRLRTSEGTPLAGARVCVGARASRQGAPLEEYGYATTDAGGRFTFDVPSGPSRRVVVVHRVQGGAASDSLSVRVPAKVSLRPSRRRLANGGRVKLAGRLRHGPVPQEGLLVELQARRGNRWQTFGTTTTGSRGRYSFTYRFTRTTGVQRYAMRAFVPRQSTYPYVAGASKPIQLIVRG